MREAAARRTTYAIGSRDGVSPHQALIVGVQHEEETTL